MNFSRLCFPCKYTCITDITSWPGPLFEILSKLPPDCHAPVRAIKRTFLLQQIRRLPKIAQIMDATAEHPVCTGFPRSDAPPDCRTRQGTQPSLRCMLRTYCGSAITTAIRPTLSANMNSAGFCNPLFRAFSSRECRKRVLSGTACRSVHNLNFRRPGSEMHSRTGLQCTRLVTAYPGQPAFCRSPPSGVGCFTGESPGSDRFWHPYTSNQFP